jgi:peptidylprolyl isomerase
VRAPRTTRLLIAALIAFVATTLLAGCGGNDNKGGSGSCEVTVTGDQGKKPDVTVPDCAAPTAMQSKDLITGTGDAAKAGDTMVVNYTLYGWEGKKLVQSSYDTGQPFPVQPVGAAQVIDGWNQGLPGMRAGGRRLLVIPASLGYGAQGTSDGSIKPNEALVFVVDAVSVTAPK